MGLWIARCMPVQLHFFIQSVRKKNFFFGRVECRIFSSYNCHLVINYHIMIKLSLYILSL